MLSKQEKARYQKQTILPEIGIEGQEKLSAAKVLVIGAGGLGCPVLLYLAAAGIGTLGIADGDVVDISNLQRQVLYTVEEIGQKKAAVAEKKLKSLNPHITVNLYPVFINSDNALEIMRDYDIVVDGSDNFATRYLINDACTILNKPMVSGAIYKFEGQVSVFNYHNGPTYRCIFPEPPQDGESPNCADIGVVASLPGIIGAIQANEVIKMVTGIGEVLSGRLLVIDTLTMNSHTFNFKLNPANKTIHTLKDNPQYCKSPVTEISYGALLQKTMHNATQLVDVRETAENLAGNIGGINIPLSTFETAYNILDPSATVILYCASGVRSKRAAELLVSKGFIDVLTLEKGINAVII